MSDTEKKQAKLTKVVKAKPKTGKPKGKPRSNKYMSLADATEIVRNEILGSASQYKEWWDKNKPAAIPRFPYRAYPDWTSWNDFLGTDNKFKSGRTTFRPFNEALIYAHQISKEQGMTSYPDWREYIRDNKDKVPSDIPSRPDVVYKSEWISWAHWLGTRPRETVEAQKKIVETRTICIVQHNDVPSNIYDVRVIMGGITGITEAWQLEQFTLIKAYWYPTDKNEIIHKIIEHNSSAYMDETARRIVPNIYQLLWSMDTFLEEARPS